MDRQDLFKDYVYPTLNRKSLDDTRIKQVRPEKLEQLIALLHLMGVKDVTTGMWPAVYQPYGQKQTNVWYLDLEIVWLSQYFTNIR